MISLFLLMNISFFSNFKNFPPFVYSGVFIIQESTPQGQESILRNRAFYLPYIKIFSKSSPTKFHFCPGLLGERLTAPISLTFQNSCCTMVKEHLGTTIYALILEERLYLAKEYILRGEKSLQEIPALFGFRDYGHFSKSFRKHVGIPPSQYRAAFSRNNSDCNRFIL